MRFWPSPEFRLAYWLRVRRLFAVFIDLVIIAVPVTALAAFLFENNVEVGPEGRLFGFSVLLAFLAISNSAITGGRSLGDRAMGLKVVDAAGKPISFGRSLLRAGIFLAPFIVAGVDFRVLTLPDGAQALVPFLFALLIVGVLAGQLYLFVFDFRGGRLLHDLAARAFVVRNAEDQGPASRRPINWIASGAIVASSLAIPLVPMSWLETWEPARSVTFPVKLWKALAEDKSLFITGYSAESSSTYVDNHWISRSQIQIWVHTYNGEDDLQRAAAKVARTILALSPNMLGYQRLIIQADSGVDLGIASWTFSVTCWGVAESWSTRQGECPVSNAY